MTKPVLVLPPPFPDGKPDDMARHTPGAAVIIEATQEMFVEAINQVLRG